MNAELLVPVVVPEDVKTPLSGRNQPMRRDFQIECSECKGLSTPNAVFFSRTAYDAAVAEIPTFGVKVHAPFIRYTSGMNEEIEIMGFCQVCRRAIYATVHFVD